MQAKNFKQAAQMSLDERWYPISKAESIREMWDIFNEETCELCSLRNRKRIKNPKYKRSCCGCSLRDLSTLCCIEYDNYFSAVCNGDFPKAQKQALLLVKRLEKIAGKAL